MRGKILDSLFGLLDLLVNVPKSRIAGGVTYLDSRVRQYTGYYVLGHVQNFAGNPLPFTSHWSYSVNADFKFLNVMASGTPFIGATVTGRSAEDAVFDGAGLNPVGDPLHLGSRISVAQPCRIPGYATVDLRIGYQAANERWRVMVFAKNAFDNCYVVNVIPGADTSARFAVQPVTYGVTFGFEM